MLIRRAEYQASDQSIDTQVSERLVIWLKQEIIKKAATDGALRQQLTAANQVWLEEQLRAFLLALREYDQDHNLSLSQLFGLSENDFVAHLASKKQRGIFIQTGIDEFVRYVKGKTDHPDYPNGRQFCAMFKSNGLDLAITRISSEDQQLKNLHADAVRSIADEIVLNGFIPEMYVTPIHLAPHTMAEKDVSSILKNVMSHPIRRKMPDGADEVMVVKDPIQPLTDAARIEQDIETESRRFMALDMPAKVTLFYPMQDGSSHYDLLEVTVQNNLDVTIRLQNSMKAPPTKDTATYKSLEAAESAVKGLAGYQVKKAEVEFTGDQDDAVSCSYRTIASIVKSAAKEDKTYADIAGAATIDQVKLAINKRLVAEDKRLGPDVANQLVIDPESRVVRRAVLVDVQADKFAKYQEHDRIVNAAKRTPKPVVTPVTQKADSARNLFGFDVKLADDQPKSSTASLLKIEAKLDEKDLDKHAITLAKISEENAALQKTIRDLPDDKLPQFNFGSTALGIYVDKAQVKEYDRLIHETKAATATAQQGTTKAILAAMTTNIESLVEKSVKAVEMARKTPAVAKPVELSEEAKKAYAILQTKPDQTSVNQARETLTALHEKMLLEDASFDESVAGVVRALTTQEIEDVKLARIVQNQYVLDYLHGRKPLSAAEELSRDLQLQTDEALARKLSKS